MKPRGKYFTMPRSTPTTTPTTAEPPIGHMHGNAGSKGMRSEKRIHGDDDDSEVSTDAKDDQPAIKPTTAPGRYKTDERYVGIEQTDSGNWQARITIVESKGAAGKQFKIGLHAKDDEYNAAKAYQWFAEALYHSGQRSTRGHHRLSHKGHDFKINLRTPPPLPESTGDAHAIVCSKLAGGPFKFNRKVNDYFFKIHHSRHGL